MFSVVVVAVSVLSVDCWITRLGRGSLSSSGQGSQGERPEVLATSILSSASLLASLQLLGRLPKLTDTCLLVPRGGGEAVPQILISQELMSRAFVNFEQCFSEERCPPPPGPGDLLNFTIGAFFSSWGLLLVSGGPERFWPGWQGST